MIFIKNPIAGKVKTRLAKDIGDEKAVEYYRRLLSLTRKAALGCKADRWLWYGDFINEEDEWDDRYFAKKLQHGESLGDRMKNAFAEGFQRGFSKVVIIGSDCPEMSSSLLEEAFERLEQNDVVTGPANDGGYYLLGMRSFQNLFDGISWSTSEVYPKTIKKIKQAGLSYEELPELTDLDTIEDLKKLSQL